MINFIKTLDNKKIMESQSYPSYIEYRYGITEDLKELHISLTKTNLLKIPEGAERLRTLKVNELKDILKANNLLTVGRKEDLITRIEENIDEDLLTTFLPRSNAVYYLSNEGKEFVKRNEFWIEWHRMNCMCDFRKLLDVFLTTQYQNFSDVYWEALQQNKDHHKKTQDYILLRNTHLHMAYLLRDKYRYEQAVIELLKVLFIDLSGYESSSRSKLYSELTIYSDVRKLMMWLSNYFDPCMFQEVYREKIPSKYFDKATFEEVAIKVVNGEDINLDKYR